MAASDDPQTLGRGRLSFADARDIDEFAAALDRFERSEMTPDQWRVFRLVRGTYGQRQTDDAQMIRVKIPQGLAEAAQLEVLADVAETYSRGFGHVTTRQNLQFHFVRLHDVEPAMRRLAEAGLTTREACGNSVRNVTSCQYAGIAADEPFDVTPFAEALTRHFLRHPLSGVLPRKFKIGFEGCTEDHAKAAINDIGWFARRQNGRNGFRVVVGGGTATLTRAGIPLFEFLPAGDMLTAAEAVVRVFHRLGDYQHKQRNRMKFLIRSLGWERWREAFDEAFAQVGAEGGIPLPFDPESPPVESAPAWRPVSAMAGDGSRPPGFARWLETNAREQKQRGYSSAVVTLSLGDITAAQLRTVAELSRVFSDGTMRVTPDQNLLLRWVPTSQLSRLYTRLTAAGLATAEAGTIADVTSCPGADSCKLAVTKSRGLGRLLESHVRANPRLIPLVPTLDVKVSGCPNGCGQHHIAAVGFQGSLRKLGDRAVPQYFVMAGGGVDGEGASFGRLVAKIPARRSPLALERLAMLFATERQGGETAAAFFTRVDLTRLKALLADLETLTPDLATDEDFVDLGETTAFVPEMTEGECAV